MFAYGRSDEAGWVRRASRSLLESRRAQEMAKLIANYGGQPIVAPSMREVPLESNVEALAFARTLDGRRF